MQRWFITALLMCLLMPAGISSATAHSDPSMRLAQNASAALIDSSISVAPPAAALAPGQGLALPGAELFPTPSALITVTVGGTLFGSTDNDELGGAISTAGDVTGDGLSDIVAGAPNNDTVYLYAGTTSGLNSTPIQTLSAPTGASDFGRAVGIAGDIDDDNLADIIVGSNDQAFVYDSATFGATELSPTGAPTDFGRSVSTAGDVDGDGNVDLIVGATGDAFVFFGPDWTTVTALPDQSATQFGRAVDTAGDLNADGFADVVVGGSDQAFVFFGPALTTVTELDPLVATTSFGQDVSAAGDVDGDGLSDVLVGDPDDARAFVFFGSDLTTPTAVTGSDNFGRAVNPAGDTNGDGFADVLVGSPAANRIDLFLGPDLTRSEGITSGDTFGSDLSTAGDVNGDGYADIIVGAPAAPGGGSSRGEIALYVGAPDLFSPTAEWSVEGNGRFGASVSTAGDINGDGYDDLIIGSDSTSAARQNAYIYYGSPAVLNLTTSGDDSISVGFSDIEVGAAGDVNGDGFADVLIGTPEFDNTFNEAGIAYLHLGSATGIDVTPAWSFEGDVTDQFVGFSVNTAGDINGDGFADVIVGAPSNATGVGEAHLFYGSSTGLSATPDWTIVGESGLLLGRSVDTAGDINGDGYSDLLVSGPGSGDERVLVFYGSSLGLDPTDPLNNADVEIRRTPPNSSDEFGWNATTAGDVNGDGFSDVLVLSQRNGDNTADAFVYYGSSSGLGADPSPDWEVNDLAFRTVASTNLVGTAGDVNADGFSDIILSDVANRQARIILGSASGLPDPPVTAQVLEQASVGNYGATLATAGDLNGDGYADVVIGTGFTFLSSNQVEVFYGNAGGGPDLAPQQLRVNEDGIPIAPLGLTDAITSVRLSAIGQMPLGTTTVSLTWQIAQVGTDFTDATVIPDGFTGTFTSGTGYTDLFATGTAISPTITGLASQGEYRWRLRLNYAPGNRLGQTASRWFFMPDNSVTEQDFRTIDPTLRADVALAPGQEDPTNGLPVTFRVTFTDSIVGTFDETNVVLGGTAPGTLTAVVSEITAQQTYDVAVSGATGFGTITLQVPANQVQNGSGEDNLASGTAGATYDPTNPVVTVDALSTPDTTPQLTGTVSDDSTTTITVTVDGSDYAVVNNGDDTWTLADDTIMPALADGVYDVTVTATDAAGNTATDATTNELTIVLPDPTIEIDTLATNDTTPELTGTVSDPTATITIGVNGTDYSATNNGDGTWTLADDTITPALADGVYDVSATATSVGSGTDDTSDELTIDTTAPTITLDLLETNDTTPALTGTVDDDSATVTVTVEGTDYTATNNGDGTWTLDDNTITPALADGTYEISVTATDGVGNTTTDTTSDGLTVDTSAPTVTVEQAAAQDDPTNDEPVNFTITFSEEITGFTTDDITLDSSAPGTIALSLLQTGTTTYNLEVSGFTGNGTLTASIAADTVTDLAGNTNLASTSTDNTVTVTVVVSVTIALATGQDDVTSTLPINFTLETSEELDSLDAADLVTGGSASGTPTLDITQVTSLTYAIAVDGLTSDGTITLNLPANRVTSLAGNPNDASNTASATYDTTAPTVTVEQAADQFDPTNTLPINFTVVFSEPITGFVAADLSVGGTAEGTPEVELTQTGSVTYTAAVDGLTSDGTVTMNLRADQVTDLAGNPNLASTSDNNTVTYDTLPPLVTINQAANQSDPTSTQPITFTVVANEGLVAFTASDITLSGPVDDTTVVTLTLTGALTYSVEVAGLTGDGTLTASIAAGVLRDRAGNFNAAATSTDNSVVYDATAPTVTVEQAADQDDPTSEEPVAFTVTFSEPITGFVAADVTLGGTVGGSPSVDVTEVTSTTYTVEVSDLTGSGTLTASVAAGVATDLNGNPNLASTSVDNSVLVDATPPEVTVEQAADQDDPTSSAPIIFTVEFSEEVSGFTAEDVVLGGTLSSALSAAVTQVTSTTYTIAVTGMAGSGTVEASIPAGAVTDEFGNENVASTSRDNTVTFDSVAPTITVDTLATSATSPALSGTVSEPDATIEVTIGGSTYTATNNGDGTWTLPAGTITPDLADGVYDVQATAIDGSGNQSSDTTTDELTIDATPPTVTVERLTTDNTSPALSGTVDDPQATIVVRVNDVNYSATNNGDGTWSLAAGTIAPLALGTYEVEVTATDASGNVGTDATADELIISEEVIADSRVFLPIIRYAGPSTQAQPDLVGSIRLEPNQTTFDAGEEVEVIVEVTNQGAATAQNFWVDLYINPATVPVTTNVLWNDVCGLDPCFGLTWSVTGTNELAPGESIELRSTETDLAAGQFYWLGWFADGTSDLYLYVDSWNPDEPNGVLTESNEANNQTSLTGLTVTGTNPLTPASAPTLQRRN